MRKPTEIKTPGDRLRLVRWERRMTLAEMGASLAKPVDPSAVYYWETMQRTPCPENRADLARKYKIPAKAWLAKKAKVAA